MFIQCLFDHVAGWVEAYREAKDGTLTDKSMPSISAANFGLEFKQSESVMRPSYCDVIKLQPDHTFTSVQKCTRWKTVFIYLVKVHASCQKTPDIDITHYV